MRRIFFHCKTKETDWNSHEIANVYNSYQKCISFTIDIKTLKRIEVTYLTSERFKLCETQEYSLADNNRIILIQTQFHIRLFSRFNQLCYSPTVEYKGDDDCCETNCTCYW